MKVSSLKFALLISAFCAHASSNNLWPACESINKTVVDLVSSFFSAKWLSSLHRSSDGRRSADLIPVDYYTPMLLLNLCGYDKCELPLLAQISLSPLLKNQT